MPVPLLLTRQAASPLVALFFWNRTFTFVLSSVSLVITLTLIRLQPHVNPGAPGGSGPADQVIDLNFDKTTIDGSVAVRSIRFVFRSEKAN